MALRNMNQTEAGAKFEDEDAATAGAVDQAQSAEGAKEATQTQVAETPASETRALTNPNPNAMKARDMMNKGSLSALKDSFHVEWNSVERILAAQGQFKFKDNDHKLGEDIEMVLLSYQDRWVCSPNDDKAPVELVKYSDDGKFATDGTDLNEHLLALKAENWTKAKIDKRMVIVGELVKETGKTESGRLNSLVQIDLPPTGAGAFNTYILQAAFAVGKGKKTFEEAQHMKLKAVTVSKPYEYTKITFSL